MAGKTRSPNYPSVSLPAALELASKLWKREGRTQVPADVAAKDLGFRSMSGSAKVALGALNQYGLVDRSKQTVKLSDLAIRILHPEDNDARMRALREAASMPELFAELHDTHAQASDEAIRAVLIGRKNFAERGAQVFLSAYRDTMALVYPKGQAYTDDVLDDQSAKVADQGGPDATPKSGMLSMNVPLGKSTLTIQIRVMGEPLKRAHIERVRKYLELAEGDLPEGD